MFENYDSFTSDANTQANSFTGPMNQAQLRNGWGMDPNLLTPSYDSPYRPQWNGNGPSAYRGNPGFWGGAGNLAFGFGGRLDHTGNPHDNWDNSIDGIVNTPAAMAAFVVQRIAAPALAFSAANHVFGPGSAGISGFFTGAGPGAKWGKSFLGGASSSFARGLGFSAKTAANVGWAGGAIGSVVGAAAVPFLAGQAVMSGLERGVFNPINNNVQTASALRSNFNGISFGEDGYGNHFTGRGLGYEKSYRMASDITSAGIKDMTFSTSEYKDLADMSMRSGLLDNSKAKDITANIKNISEQVKLIMAISKDPSVQGAIESLSKLNLAGASAKGGFSQASMAYSQIGMSASMAGMSVQKFMDTVGSQGEYLFRQNGMTPYQGQLVAGSAIASLSSANRVGLISPAQLARMGGLEGATQSSVTGQINASQTMFNRARLYNEHFDGGSSSGLVGAISQYSQNMTRDPLGTMGRGILHGAALIGNDIAANGAGSIEAQVEALAQIRPDMRGPDGKLDPYKAAPIMKSMLRMSDDEINAFMMQRMGEVDPEASKVRMAGIRSQERDRAMSTVDQRWLYNGTFGKPVRSAMQLGRSITSEMKARLADPFTDMLGLAGSAAQDFSKDWHFGESLGDPVDALTPEGHRAIYGGSKDQDENLNPGLTLQYYSSYRSGNRSDTKEALSKLKEMATGGGVNSAQAMAALNSIASGNPDKKLVRIALGLAIKDTHMEDNSKEDKEFMLNSLLNKGSSKDFASTVYQGGDVSGVYTQKGSSTSAGDINLSATYNNATGLKDSNIQDDSYYIGMASSLMLSGYTAGDKKFEGDPRLTAISKRFGITDPEELYNKIKSMNGFALENGLDGNSLESMRRGTLEDMIKNNGRDLKDPELRAKFLKADKATKAKIAAEYTTRVTGEVTGIKHKGASSWDRKDMVAALGDDAAATQAKSEEFNKRHSAFSFDDLAKNLKSIDGAANTFERAAKIFAKANKMSDAEINTALGGDSPRDNQKADGKTGSGTMRKPVDLNYFNPHR